MQLLQVLKNRLLLTDLVKRNPEIRDIELVPPVVIAGLPRTGTTHLHNLLAAGPTFRVLRYWESHRAVPDAGRGRGRAGPALARTDMAVDFMNQAMPHFRLMHEMTTDHVHEEIQLLFNDVSSMLMETLGTSRRGATTTSRTTRRRTTSTCGSSCRRSSTCAAAGGGCSSRRSTSSSCRCWNACSPARRSWSPTATRCR